MSDIIDINAKRAPVIYSVTIAHHYDGTLEFNIEDVADDERSREAVLHAFRRISGADEEIEKLTTDLKKAIYSDSEYCQVVSAENSELRARIAELEAALSSVLIGGNHLALLIGADHPLHTASHDEARAHYGSGDIYEIWCCWRAMMNAGPALDARAALKGENGAQVSASDNS